MLQTQQVGGGSEVQQLHGRDKRSWRRDSGHEGSLFPFTGNREGREMRRRGEGARNCSDLGKTLREITAVLHTV